MIKKNLKTVKNKLLCELEDYIVDGILPQLSGGEVSEEFATELMQTMISAVKNNAVRFAIICYTSDEGKELQESDLVDIPLKLMIIQECIPEIMEILSDYLEGDAQDEGKQRPKVIRQR